MDIRSLGYRTDLIFPAFDGEIVDRGDYLVVRSPANPMFYWGNFLLFSQPPERDDYQRWRDLFAKEIGSLPEIEHQTFGWDSPEGDEGDTRQFLESGFRLSRGVVMLATELQKPPAPSALLEIRALKSDSEWEQALANQVECREKEFGETEYRAFRLREMDRYSAMVNAGLGDWFGAFVAGQLVADLGLFHHQGVGRFQSVQTHPEFRRQGIAGALILAAGRKASAEYDLHTLVIVAEPHSSPARLYRSLGFQPREKQVGLEWWRHMETRADDGA